MSARNPSLWLAIPSVLVAVLVWTNNDFPLDYWWHVNHGRWMVEHRQCISVDHFSHTIAGQSVRNQPWLAQLLMFRLHSWGGYPLNQLVAGLAYAAALGGATWLVWRRTGDDLLAGLWGVATLAMAATNLGVRPQCFSLVLFVSEWMLLLRVRRTSGVACGCFAIAAAWTNLHGAYPLAVMTPALLAAAAWWNSRGSWRNARFQRFAVSTLAAGIGTALRPFPADVWGYVCNVSSRAVDRGIEEWLPTTGRDVSGAAMFAVSLLCLVMIARSRRRLTVRDGGMLVLFLLPAITSQRMIIWWAFVCPLAMSRLSRSAWIRWRHSVPWSGRSGYPERRPARAWEMPTACLVAGVALFASNPWARTVNPLLSVAKRTESLCGEPYDLAAQLQRVVAPTRSFAPLSWSSYFSWHTRGQLQSFVDSRVDYFPDRVWNDFVRIRDGSSESLRLLDDYQVELVVCERAQAGLTKMLLESLNWSIASEGELGVIFVRQASCQPQALYRAGRETDRRPSAARGFSVSSTSGK